ncbi:MAG: pyruvate formate-lyase-activating protein [Tepidisphaeraceae bacterium]
MHLPLLGSPFELRIAKDPHTERPDEAGQYGFVHSFHSGSTVDGPGVRLVIFLTGCEFRCSYCHNPDTWKIANGRRVSVADMRREIGKYAKFLKLARGGITISGGEPLVQAKFVMSLVEVCRSLGLPVALDTNGFLGSRLTDADIEKIDLFLLDIKAGFSALHERVTAQPLEPVLEFAQRLSRLDRPTVLRFVLVPGLTDAPENIERIAEIAAEMRVVRHVDVLPFHQLGKYKWAELGMKYELADTREATPEQVARAKAIFAAQGLSV